jgi:hypothetical protein
VARLVQAFQTGLALVLLAGFVGGLFVLVVMPFELLPMHAARTWPARQGVIEASRTTFARGGGTRPTPFWRVDIRGAYADSGEEFRISRIRYGDFRWGDGRAQAEADTRRYAVGSVVDVYYSPSSPSDTVLEPLAPWDTMLILLGLAVAFVATPPLLFLASYAARRGSAGKPAQRTRAVRADSPRGSF